MAQVILFPGAQPSDSEVSGSYAFHDPAFTRWWLDSLYTVPMELQIEVASQLREAVHAPAVLEVIDEFIGRTVGQVDLQEHRGAVARSDTVLESEEAPTVMNVLQRAWRAAPMQTGLGVVGLLLMVVTGAWAVFSIVVS